MIVVIAVAALLVIGLAVALASGWLARMSVHRTDPVSTAGGRPLPEGEILSDDVEHLRFDLALRGYRMDQVDEAIERLRLRLAEVEEELAAAGPGVQFSFDEDEHLGGSVSMFPVVRHDMRGDAEGSDETGAGPSESPHLSGESGRGGFRGPESSDRPDR